MLTLEDLPDDIFLKLFSDYLSIQDILNLSQVSKKMNRMTQAESESYWKDKIEIKFPELFKMIASYEKEKAKGEKENKEKFLYTRLFLNLSSFGRLDRYEQWTCFLIENRDINLDVFKSTIEFVDKEKIRKYLYFSIFSKNLSVIKIIVENDVIILNCIDNFGKTPLLLAVDRGCDSIVEYFCQQEITDLNKKLYCPDNADHGKTPLLLAIERGRVSIVEMLLKSGANPEAYCGFKNFQALHLAVSKENEAIILAILNRYKTIIDNEDAHKRTALVLAIKKQNISIVKTLLAYGANPKIASDNRGFNALQIAVDLEDIDIVKLIVMHDPSLLDVVGDNSLLLLSFSHWGNGSSKWNSIHAFLVRQIQIEINMRLSSLSYKPDSFLTLSSIDKSFYQNKFLMLLYHNIVDVSKDDDFTLDMIKKFNKLDIFFNRLDDLLFWGKDSILSDQKIISDFILEIETHMEKYLFCFHSDVEVDFKNNCKISINEARDSLKKGGVMDHANQSVLKKIVNFRGNVLKTKNVIDSIDELAESLKKLNFRKKNFSLGYG